METINLRNLELKIARVRKGMSQYLLSYETGIPQVKISLFERGFKQPNKEQARRIANALQVSVEQIFPGSFPLPEKIGD